jgi:hypothetical protein
VLTIILVVGIFLGYSAVYNLMNPKKKFCDNYLSYYIDDIGIKRDFCDPCPNNGVCEKGKLMVKLILISKLKSKINIFKQ